MHVAVRCLCRTLGAALLVASVEPALAQDREEAIKARVATDGQAPSQEGATARLAHGPLATVTQATLSVHEVLPCAQPVNRQ
jgi:hypothetical protein